MKNTKRIVPISTKWNVITGGPCSGKTTIINELMKLGYETVCETGRDIINNKLKNGYDIETVTGNQLNLQREIIFKMYEIELSLDPNNRIFLDRALPDGIGFYLYNKFDIKELLDVCNSFRYKNIFLLEQIPCKYVQYDEIRLESFEKSIAISKNIEEGYKMLNYNITRIPFMSVQKRLKLILESTQ